MAGLRSRSNGFTLVEMLVVIAVMSIIAALLIVAAASARRKVDADAAKAEIQFIASKLDAYKTKRGDLPADVDADGITTETEIYYTLAQWGLEVPADTQVDPWGNPYIIVFQRDYIPNAKVFPIATGGAGSPPASPSGPYGAPPFNKVMDMYNLNKLLPPVDGSKEIHPEDPATTEAYMSEPGGYQIICAGEDGLISRDNREVTSDVDGDETTVNADNYTNW